MVTTGSDTGSDVWFYRPTSRHDGPLTGNLDSGVLLTGVALVAGVLPGELRGKLVGGKGVELEVVGEDVPGAEGSVTIASAGADEEPAPMSMKSERSFLSRA